MLFNYVRNIEELREDGKKHQASSYTVVQRCAYLVQNYIPLRTWPLEATGYFFELALTNLLKDTDNEMDRQKVTETLHELQKRMSQQT